MHHLSLVSDTTALNDKMMVRGILRASQGPHDEREQLMLMDTRKILSDMVAQGVDRR